MTSRRANPWSFYDRAYSVLTWLVIGLMLASVVYFATGCASEPTVKTRIVDGVISQVQPSWFERIVNALAEKAVEIAAVVTTVVITAVAIGGNVGTAIVYGLAALGASFGFRPAQSVTNVDTGGGSYSGGDGGGMGFLSYVGLFTIIWLIVKYLVIPRSARNFWGGLIGFLFKPGQRRASLRKMVSSSGVAHTSKETARVAKAEALKEKTT